MKKLMLIYYNIVAVLTILYLVLTATLMNLGNAYITTQGWHVVILGVLILVIVFGMEFAKKKFPDDFFEFIIECRPPLYRMAYISRSIVWGHCFKTCHRFSD